MDSSGSSFYLSVKKYQPLIVIIGISLLAAAALYKAGLPLMDGFMGWFLICFSMLKLFDIEGFATGFRQYDLLAKRSTVYAKIYPFIELAIGLLYLSGLCPFYTNIATLVVMVFGALGIIRGLQSGRPLECACLGSLLKVPLGTVSIVENFGMAAMATAMLIAG